MTAAAVIRALDARGVRLHLDGDRVRWQGPMPKALLAAARAHRDTLIGYLRRVCTGCGCARPVMVLMEADGSPWWLCAPCWLQGALRRGTR